MITDSDPSGKSIQYFYDSKGNNVKQILRSGKEILFTYDDFNNLIKKEVLGDTKSLVEYTYDSNNQLIRMKDSLGTTTYDYFRDGKLKSKTHPDNLSLTYNYDLQGNLIESKDIEGNKTRFHYSPLNGKLIKSEFINLNTAKTLHENSNYDGLGRIKQRNLANSSEV
jgi:YD repeat-containing protein